MVFESDPLQDFDLENKWPILEQALMKNWPRSILIIRWITTRMNWDKKEPGKHPYHVCCPGGELKNGLVTFGRTGGRFIYFTVFDFDNKTDSLKDALLKTKRIDWHDRPFCGVPEGLIDWFYDISNTLGYEIQIDDPSDYLWIPKTTAINFPLVIPKDLYIEKLKPEDIIAVNSLWPHSFSGSEDYLKDIIRLNYGMGVYSKATDELLSWGLNYDYGDIGVLQTKDEHKRRGLATLAVVALSIQMARDGEHPYAFYIKHNTPSKKLFEKLGFEFAGCYNWIVFK